MNVLESLRDALRRAREREPGFTEQMSEAALIEILALLGGERIVVPKTMSGKPGRPAISEQVGMKAYSESLQGPRAEVAASNGISRSTLYRLMKRQRKR